MTTLILLRAINLARYLSCNVFEGGLVPWTITMCLDRLDCLGSSCHSGYTVLANRAGWRVAGDLVPWESTDNYDVRSILLGKKTLKHELQKWQLGPREILLSCPPAPPGCPGYPSHPSSCPPSLPHHHHPPSFPPHPPPTPSI